MVIIYIQNNYDIETKMKFKRKTRKTHAFQSSQANEFNNIDFDINSSLDKVVKVI